jgi:ribosome-binding protein aMBF1 (putative translation factor)
MVGEKVHVIKEYEAGRGIANGATLAKIERALGIKLRESAQRPAADDDDSD